MDWFMADPHFYHYNIMKYDKRPFATMVEMNNIIIDNINFHVKPSDMFYLLGDFCFTRLDNAIELRKRIKCKRITLIYGNHDNPLRKKSEFRELWHEAVDLKQIKCGKHTIVLFHYPIEDWNKKFHGSLHLHGHTHKHSYMPNRLCISANLWDYKPINYKQILDALGLNKNLIL